MTARNPGDSDDTAPPAAPCPRCGFPASGAFCSECGAALGGAVCLNCQSPLTPGAKFCHRCGTPTNSRTPVPLAAKQSSDPLPWAVAAIALVALIAMLVASQLRGGRQDTVVGEQTAPPFGAGRAPDISRMSPRQITDALFEKVMILHERGLDDSVRYIALTMALPAYEMHDSLDTDLRYDYGRVAEVSGVLDVAKAQADTILREHPTHLLGLLLASRVATLLGDSAAARAYDQRLLAAEKEELALNRDEYQLHKNDIDAALAAARRRGR